MSEMNKKISRMKELENRYIEDLLYYLDINIKIVGGMGVEGLRDMKIEELARHLFPNGIEFKIHNRRVVLDPLKE